jgi:anti-anti-sigma regulatory factor
MIIETKDDVVSLSGSLHKNQWLTIKAAANLLLQQHPQGIIVDCSHLEDISEDGAKTFLEAMRDIEAAKARIIVANLPEAMLSVCRMVPGVRSQLPIADSVEAARASLRLANRAAAPPALADGARRGAVILVPLLADMDLTYGADLAGRLARSAKAELRLTYFLEVARTLPLNAPLLEEEQAAQDSLARAMQYAKQHSVPAWEHVERVRDAAEGILAAVKTHNAQQIVLGATNEPVGGEAHDAIHELIDTLLHRAPCEVIIGRLKPNL